jgi:hypothetical protein
LREANGEMRFAGRVHVIGGDFAEDVQTIKNLFCDFLCCAVSRTAWRENAMRVAAVGASIPSEEVPQGLKPSAFDGLYGRAEARALHSDGLIVWLAAIREQCFAAGVSEVEDGG